MKILTKILYFFIFIFFLNIFFYYISLDYKEFLENLKYWETINELEKWNENFNWEKINNLTEIKIEKIDKVSNDIEIIEEKDNLTNVQIWKDNLIENKDVVLWKNYRDVLEKFLNIYDLSKIEINTLLFEITNEYPDYYYEYYSKDFTLYFFTTKNYNQIYDIFSYLQEDWPFSINEVNNFWEKSFYINMDKEVNDDFIRLVITQNGITYWIKVKNEQYDTFKNILLNNFNN